MKEKTLVLIFLVLFQFVAPVVGETYESKYLYTMCYCYENRGTEPLTITEEETIIPVFWDTEWHSTKIVNSSHPIEEKNVDEDGNPTAMIQIPVNIPSTEKVNFSITYEINSRNRDMIEIDLDKPISRDAIPPSLIQEYCVATETFMSNDSNIIEMAINLANNEESVLLTVLNLVTWFINNASYANFEVPKYPNETLRDGIGDCDDQAILLISMLRSLDIPAFLQVGIVVHRRIQSNKESWEGHLDVTQDGVGWHGWTMVYLPPWGWLPIDLTLTQKETAIEIMNNAPEFNSYIIPVLNISKQAYIGDTLKTREEIINSDLYITVVDRAVEINENNLVLPDLKIVILASLLLISITSMFIVSRKQ